MKARKSSWMTATALGTLLALMAVTHAQENKGSEPKPKAPQRERAARAHERANRLADELNLTEEQKTKLQAVMKEQNEKLRELRQDTALSREEMRTKARELRQALAGKVKTILNAEQYEKWEKRQQAGARPHSPRPERLSNDKPAGDKPSQPSTNP